MNAIIAELLLLLLFRVNQNEQQILLVICGGGWILLVSRIFGNIYLYSMMVGGWGIWQTSQPFCMFMALEEKRWAEKEKWRHNLCPKMLLSSMPCHIKGTRRRRRRSRELCGGEVNLMAVPVRGKCIWGNEKGRPNLCMVSWERSLKLNEPLYVMSSRHRWRLATCALNWLTLGEHPT